jgi:hypothetical protein
MNQPPRDWDKELADIDKVIEKQGPAVPAGRALPAGTTAAVPAPVAKRSVALTWFWAALALALAVALPVWPYDRTCGLRLTFFLGATAITLLAGFLGALASWAHRRGFAHLVSLLVLAWALVVAASEVLPRIGYAKESRTWLCADSGPAPAPATAPAPTTP